MWKTWQYVICWLAIPLLFFLAWFLHGAGFDELRQMRQLERLPRTNVISAIPGEINLEGQVAGTDELLQAPHSQVECVYYLYILEERRTDSDGDSYWAVIDRQTDQVVDFRLEDPTGTIRVRPAGADINVDMDRDRIGDLRHTEYRLHPNDTVFVFGYISRRQDLHVVEFETGGLYTPIISTQGEREERRHMASSSVISSFLALMAASFAVMLFCWVLKVHRLLVFLSAVSLVQALGLVYLGLTMLKFDLESSYERTLLQQQRAEEEIQYLLDSGDIPWSGDWGDANVFQQNGALDDLPSATRSRIYGIYGNIAASITRLNTVQARFPERVLAQFWHVPSLREMFLPSASFPGVDQQRVIEMVPIRGWVLAFMLGLGVPAAIVFPWWGFGKIREKRYIENIPTSATVGLAYGPAELKGAARKETKLLRGPVSGADCVYYHYEVRALTGAGKNAQWVTITDEKMHEAFVCQDAHGSTPVDLMHAEVHSKHQYIDKYTYRSDETNPQPGELFSSSLIRGGSLSSGGQKRVATEVSLLPGDDLYILGPAIIDERTGDQLKIGKDESEFPLIVSNWTEEQVMARKGRRGLGLLNLGLNGLVLAGLAVTGATASYAPTDYLLAAFIAPAFLGVCFVVLMYNDLEFVRQRVARAWANIDVSLKKRAELVPNIEAVAKRYLAHEAELQGGISKMRARLQSNLDPGDADELIDAEKIVAGRLFATVEDHPDLKGDEVTRSLFNRIVALENEITLMREGYNDSVERYNTRIQRLPEVMLAKLLGYRHAQALRADFGQIRPAGPAQE